MSNALVGKLSWKGINSRKTAAAAILVEAALIIVLFMPTLAWMNERFFEENSYYGHGWLIPAAVAFLIWRKRRIFSRIPSTPRWSGLFLVAFGVLLYLAARAVEINFLAAMAFFPLITGLVLFQWGTGWTGLILPPLLLLVFMIPLPGIWIISITFHLKNFSAAVGVELARFCGIDIIRRGVEIILPGAPPGQALTIGDPCSGLRSLISFGALGGFFAILLPVGLFRRLLIFLTALILAPLSNIFRVFLLILLRRAVGDGILSGPWHITLGIVLFFLAFLIFLQVVRWLLS